MMRPELLYLPVSRDERALLRWLRTSTFASNLGDLTTALDAASRNGLDARSLAELAAATPQETTDDTPIRSDLAALTQRLESERSQLSARLDDVETRLSQIEARAPGVPSPPEEAIQQDPRGALEDGARIGVVINGHLVQGDRVPIFMQRLAELLWSRGWVTSADLPLRMGRKRYIMHTEPVHPSGKPFFSPVEFDGLHVETHQSFKTTARAVDEDRCRDGHRVRGHPPRTA